MKLSTMLLPTGEFMLIGSNCKQPHPSAELLVGLKEAIGAAAVLILEQDVEIDNALFDEAARRVEAPVVDPQHLQKTFFPHATDSAGREFSVEFTAGSGDSNLFKQYFGGADFSPAGLVKSVGDRDLQERADDGLVSLGQGINTRIDVDAVLADDLEAVLAEPARLDSQNVTLATNDPYAARDVPGEFGRSPYTGPQNHVLDLDPFGFSSAMAPDEPYRPKVGDRVRINGKSLFGVDFTGAEGVVQSTGGTWRADGRVSVQTEERDNTDVPLICVQDLEPLDG
jgi:hypothetical protein